MSKTIWAEKNSAVAFADHNYNTFTPHQRTGMVEVTVTDNDGVITTIVMAASAAAYLVQTLGEVLYSQMHQKELQEK